MTAERVGPVRGRRPGTPDTRGEILAAARGEFAGKGYDGATMRGIAARADVDAALVHHYFGTKEQLFAAAMQLPFDAGTMVPSILEGDPDQLGERIVRVFLGVWGNDTSRAPIVAMLRSAMTHDAAAAMLRQFVSRALLGRIAAGLELPDAQLRVSLAASQLVGLAILRYVVRIEPLAAATEDELVRLVAPAVQRYLTA